MVVLANKQDSADRVEEEDLRKIFQVDLLKSTSRLRFFVKNTIGRTGQGISECFSLFEGRD